MENTNGGLLFCVAHTGQVNCIAMHKNIAPQWPKYQMLLLGMDTAIY